MKAILTLTTIISMAILLSSCSGMFTNQARCPFKDKGGCQSVSDVNKMIDEGRYTDDGRFVQQAGDDPNAFPASTPQFAQVTGGAQGWNSPTPYAGEPMRTKEVDARMWVAPWLDTNQAYHGASYVNFVVEGAKWANLPANAIRSNQYDDRG